jgi:hypothetical protein
MAAPRAGALGPSELTSTTATDRDPPEDFSLLLVDLGHDDTHALESTRAPAGRGALSLPDATPCETVDNKQPVVSSLFYVKLCSVLARHTSTAPCRACGERVEPAASLERFGRWGQELNFVAA